VKPWFVWVRLFDPRHACAPPFDAQYASRP
jgi:hypothetical protein